MGMNPVLITPGRQFHPTERGFTLIELMIVLLIASILAAIAVPSFQNAIANQKAKKFAQELYLTLSQARAEAIKLNGLCDISVVPVTVAKWHEGWSIQATGATCAGAPLTLAQVGETTGIADISHATVGFDRRGRPVGAVADWSICDIGGHGHQRTVSLGLTGAPKVDVDYTGTC